MKRPFFSLFILFSTLVLAKNSAEIPDIRPGDIVGMNGPSFAYELDAGGEINFVVPSGGRVQIIEKVGDGYLVEALPEWTDSLGNKKIGSLLLADDETKTIAAKNQQFIIYPSLNGHDKQTLILIKRDATFKAAQKKNPFESSRQEYEEPSHNSAPHAVEVPEDNAKNLQGKALVATQSVHLRAGPSTNTAIIGGLSPGEEVKAIAEQNGWTFVQIASRTGWIKSEYLEPKAKAPLPPEEKSVTQTKDCLPFSPSNYTPEKVKAFVLSQKKLKKTNIPQLKANFRKFFAPLALHLSEVSGYPASVMMAQFLEETGWGSSHALATCMNIAGVSCYEYHEDYKVKTLKFSKNGKEFVVKNACMHERPKREGAYYRSYPNIVQSGYAYVHNLVDNPRTAKIYEDLRVAVKNKKIDAGTKRARVTQGLKRYAPGGTYPAKILDHIKNQNLRIFDTLGVCK